MSHQRTNSPHEWALTAVLSLTALLPTTAAAQAPDKGGSVVVLDGSSFWRVRESFADPLVKTADGLKSSTSRSDPFCYTTLWPGPGWAEPDFDDSGWGRRHYFFKFANGEWDHRAGGGGQSASTEAAGPDDGQFAVIGGFTWLHAVLVVEAFQQTFRTVDVASRSGAHNARMLTGWF